MRKTLMSAIAASFGMGTMITRAREDDDPRTPTGRIPSEPEIQFLPVSEQLLHLRELIDQSKREMNEVTGLVNDDFSTLEDRVSAYAYRHVDIGRDLVDRFTSFLPTSQRRRNPVMQAQPAARYINPPKALTKRQRRRLKGKR